MRDMTGEQSPARIATIGNMTAEGAGVATGREEPQQEHSRFKGTGRGSLVWLIRGRCVGIFRVI